MRSLPAVILWVFCAPVIAALEVSGNAQDIDRFLRMLEECTGKELGLSREGTVLLIEEPPLEGRPQASEALRALLNEILVGNYTLNIALGRSQALVLADRFLGDGAGRVDVDDLEQFPETPPSQSPNCVTRCEVIAHILGEYRRGATNAVPGLPIAPDYNDSHPVPYLPNRDPDTGLGSQNSHRQALGQSTSVDSIVGVAGIATLTFSDGSQAIMNYDAGLNITFIRCP